jgi:hypothetical protein
MRSLAGQLLVPLLATLLVLTTPVGTGQGVHANELLHPLLPHMHLVDGRILTDGQVAAARPADGTSNTQAPPGPSFGAGSGADAPAPGLALGPTLFVIAPAIAATPEGRLQVLEDLAPSEFRDPPRDPPPDPFA